MELDLLDTVVQPDMDESQEMGDDTKEATEEEMDQASDLRGKAAKAYSDGDFETSVNFYTEAILLNPTALFYAKRGQAFLKLNKPNAAIRDCDRALKLNPDSATAYKFRGRANRLLGNWEAAAKDLRQACKLDYDDETDEWLKEVTPNAKKIEQHKIKQERRKAEKDLEERKERVRRAQEANKRAAEENKNKHADEDDGGDFGMGGLPPDFMEAFSDPEVSAALQDVMTNPANIIKYQNNPKVMNLLKKFAGAAGGGGFPGMGAGGGGGMGGGFPGEILLKFWSIGTKKIFSTGMGGFPGFPGGPGGFPGGPGGFPGAGEPPKSDPKPKQEFDDGLD